MDYLRKAPIALLGAVAAILMNAPTGSAAGDWPSQPIEVIVPFGAGGGSDGIVRIIQREATKKGWLSQPLVVQNIGGAGGRTGSRQAMESDSDGYTFLTNHMTLMTGQATGTADFGHRDFEPVAATGSVCMIVGVPEASPFKSLADLLEASTREPIVYGANLGALNHMAGLTVQNSREGAQFRFVQIGGDTENFIALAGEVIPAAGMSTQQFRSGDGAGVRALAVLSDERDPALPDVPTAKEQGFDATFCFEYWWFAPKGTSRQTIDQMADVLETAMKDEDVLSELEKRAIQPVFRRGEAFQSYLDEQWMWVDGLAKQAAGK